MSQTNIPPSLDASLSTENNDSLTVTQTEIDTGANLSRLSHAGTPRHPEADQKSPGSPSMMNLSQTGPSQYGYYYSMGATPSPHYVSHAYYPVPATAWTTNSWSSPHTGGIGGSFMPHYSHDHVRRLAQPTSLHPVSSPVPPATGVNHKQSPSAAPSPSPPVELQGHWDRAIRDFLSSAGLTQALRGFEADIIVMSAEWERKRIPSALEGLMKNILTLKERQIGTTADEMHDAIPQGQTLEDRKLQYLHLTGGKEPRSPASTIQDISKFLARNRARNDASNRQEFLQRKDEKSCGSPDDPAGQSSNTSSCARTDARAQNRDVQMKYDIAKNEDGPLRKTLHGRKSTSIAGREQGPEQAHDASRTPSPDERLRNIEAHLAVRYVPSPPKSFMDRLRFLEDHIVELEKEYPPWAALHFNQPRRGWPPPPRPTPIIVPSHLTSTASHTSDSGPSHDHSSQVSTEAASKSIPISVSELSEPGSTRSKGKSGRAKSSLHRAVMERLEVQRAIHDLAGAAGDG